MELVEDNQQQVDAPLPSIKTESAASITTDVKSEHEHESDPAHDELDEPTATSSSSSSSNSSNDSDSDANEQQQSDAVTDSSKATATVATEPEAAPVASDDAPTTAVASVTTVMSVTTTVETTVETVATETMESTTSEAAAIDAPLDQNDDAPLQLSDLVLTINSSDDDDDERFADARQENDADASDADASDADASDADALAHELRDLYADRSLDKAPGSGHTASNVPTTISYSVNEMEVITNRGGRSGSLSKFLDDSDSYRRRSLQDDPLFGSGGLLQHHKSMTLDAFLAMGIDPILEILDDTDSDIRLWLMTPATVTDVLAEFITPPVFLGDPHDEYGYYKKHFVCSEIIMKLYTGEEDLYESFSSDSSSGSATTTAVFGCSDAADIAKWAQLYAIFDNPQPLDEMQLLFFSKALVRLHDGFCLEEGYVPNVLQRFLPTVVPHLYSNTIKYMLTLILQSYESVHPITGRNDAMEIVAPLLAHATQVNAAIVSSSDGSSELKAQLVENTSHLIVDMLQANQADRLGSFCRREGGVYLSKYFVRDQFGTIRGFESMTHGYHNFLQYMLLEELGKHATIVDELFANAHLELAALRANSGAEASSSLNVHMATELLLLCAKYQTDALESDETNVFGDSDVQHKQRGSSFGYGSFSAEQFASSPRESTTETAMYNLATLAHGAALWTSVKHAALATADAFVSHFDCGLAPSVEIALAKHLHALVALNDEAVNAQLHASGLIAKYLRVLTMRSRFDMLLIHVVPAVSFILRDADGARAKNCPLTKDLFGVDVSDDDSALTIVDVLVLAKHDVPTLRIYAAVLHDVLDEVVATTAPTQNNAQVLFHCKRSSAYAKLTGRTSSYSKRVAASAADESQASATSVPAAATDSVDTVATSDDVATANANSSSSTSDCDAATPTRVSLPSTNDVDASRNSDKLPPPPPPPPVATPSASTAGSSTEKDTAPQPQQQRKSTHYFKNVLQSPVFKSPMRLGSVIKVPEKPASSTSPQESDSGQAAGRTSGSFAWNNVFKKLRNSWVATHHATADKANGDKKLLALTHEPFAHALTPRQSDVLVVDTARGDDVTKLVHRDGGVSVTDVPIVGTGALNVLTAGYMYKNKLPETGQRHVWERLFFVLNRAEGSLSYYISEAHAKDRTYVRGTARPVGVSDGLPVHVAGQQSVFGFQITTQGHGAFLVLVDSIDTRLTWLTEIHVCVSAAAPAPTSSKRLSLLGSHTSSSSAASDGLSPGLNTGMTGLCTSTKWTKAALKAIVVELYQNLYGPHLKFATPLEAPASFWMEEKIDPVDAACVLSSNLPESVPYWGEFHGYKRVCEYWKTRDETLERSSGRVLRIVVDEDEETAVVMTSTTFRILRNSQIVTEESCDILSLSGGAIVSIHCTFDSYRIAEAFQKEGISAP